jgi:hypothetical protein
LGSFWKNYRSVHFGIFFPHGPGYASILKKKCVLGDFSTNSSGHTEGIPQFQTAVHFSSCISWKYMYTKGVKMTDEISFTG